MTPRPAAGIEVRGVRKHFADAGVTALDEVSLSIAPGEFVSLLGPSGCGKSTLLRCIAGIETPTAGSITVNGTVVRGPPEGLGMVFQRDALLDWRTVADNLMLPVDFRRGDRRAARVRADSLLALTGLQGFEQRYPAQLSGGMRQRVALCRALVDDPVLLLMDEPFGALDALTREQIAMDIQRLWMDKRKTALHITHSIPEAVLLADRVVVMGPRPGRIVEIIDIDLPRPRRLDKLPAEFNVYAGRIRDIFKSKGVLAMD